MMNAIQVTATKPRIYVNVNASRLHCFPSKPCALPMKWDPLSTRTSVSLRAKHSPGLQRVPILESRKPLHVCLAGGQGMMENNKDGTWTSFDKTMEQFKGQSIEDLFRQQIQKGEYHDNGGNGAKPPHGGGGGCGGGPGGSEDGRFAGMSDETFQVVLATIGFMFLYICVIDGAELAKLARDCINYLITGKQSVRLKRTTYKWVRFYRMLTEKKEAEKHQLENAPTWNNPDYYRDAIRNYMKPNSDE